jgi:hypothetical protein
VLDGLRDGFAVRLIVPATRGIDQPAAGPDPGIEELAAAGAEIED